MGVSSDAVGGGADGGISNFYGELPARMNHHDISLALIEMDTAVRGIREPLVATIFSDICIPEQEGVEDYRLFYVLFEEAATTEDMVAALRIVTDALKNIATRAR